MKWFQLQSELAGLEQSFGSGTSQIFGANFEPASDELGRSEI
jgi:hypothetical protein